MIDMTQTHSAIEQSDPSAAQLLPLVYDELHKLAAQKLAHVKPGQTLQATALVHEAYAQPLEAPNTEAGSRWNSPAASSPPTLETSAGTGLLCLSRTEPLSV